MNKEDLLIIDDKSPKVWVIEANPLLDNVGTYTFKVSNNNNYARNLAISVREVNDLPETIRGSGGFGSTGK